MEIRISKPKEFIYCLLYKEPHNTEYLCKELYEKKRNSRVSHWVKELHRDGHIKRRDTLSDQRYWLYSADPKYLYKSILQSIDNWIDSNGNHQSLSSDERKILFKIINSKSFKNFVDEEIAAMIIEQRGGDPFQRIKSCISEYCMFILAIDDIIEYEHGSKFLEYAKESFPYKSSVGLLSIAFVEANPTINTSTVSLIDTLGYLLGGYHSYMSDYLSAMVTIAKKFL